jgi:hypothetical protein
MVLRRIVVGENAAIARASLDPVQDPLARGIVQDGNDVSQEPGCTLGFGFETDANVGGEVAFRAVQDMHTPYGHCPLRQRVCHSTT